MVSKIVIMGSLLLVLSSNCTEPNGSKSDQYDTNAVVTKWLNNHAAAISMTHDTGSIEWDKPQAALAEVLNRGLTMDYEFVSAPQHLWPEKIVYINEFCIPNNIQFYGHGNLHIDHDALTYEDALASFSLNASIMRGLGLKVVASAYPMGRGHEAETRLAVKNAGFLSGRRHHPGDRSNPFIVPYDQSVPDDWFALPTLVMQDYAYANLDLAVNDTEELIPLLESALTQNAWLITTYHAIGYTAPSYGFYTMENFIGGLDAISTRDFWSGSFNDVTLYVYERNMAVVTDSIISGPDGVEEIQISVEDGLDDELFDQPLTIKMDLPDDWIEARIELRDETAILDTLDTDDKPLYFNALPDNRLYRLKKIDTAT